MRRLRGEQAATTSEYVGLVVVVAMLVGALIVNNPAGLGRLVQGTIQAAFCRVVALVEGSGECATGEGGPSVVDEAAYRPEPCVVSSRERDTQGTVEALFFEVGKDRGFLWEEKSDGSVELTLLVKARGGVGGEVGAEGGITHGGVHYGLKAHAEADVVMAAETGKTWVFEGPDGEATAGQVVDWIQREYHEDTSGLTRRNITSIVEKISDEPDPPVHTREFVAGGVEASAQASASGMGLEVEAEVHSAVKIGTDYVVDGRGRLTKERDEYYEVSLGAGAQGSVGPFGIGAAGDKQVMVILSYEADNKPVQLTVVDTTTGAVDRELLAEGEMAEEGFERLAEVVESGEATATGGDEHTTVITSRVDLTTPQERQLASQWVTTFANGEEIDEMMRERGRISVISYDGHTTGIGVRAKLAAGAKIGLELGRETTDATVVDALYLGPPDETGTREMQVFTSCLEARS